MDVVGFEGDGYMEFPSSNMADSAGISLTFRTQQPNTLLLLARGTKPQVIHLCQFHVAKS